ncbi:hypothetical protein [Thermoflexibacter ruber]|uniref:Uncharacterized protein n=1 Tax=Thermoflexibacter ruber TaxID=1003 RepID=A0A1I2BTV7_9BACT|nr:hypothetical protein [Thermoflexibacter ruber]SFE59529.1 hypothetical protein SAMN04488541_1003153 [Thermoflexibacter ruber]
MMPSKRVIAISPQECWTKLMKVARRIEEGASNIPFPSKEMLKVRLFSVLEKDYEYKRYDAIRKKINLLQIDERKRSKLSKVSDVDLIKTIKEDIYDYLPVEIDTIEANFTGKADNARNRFKNFIAIVYGNSESFDEYYRKKSIPPSGLEGEWVAIVRSHNGEELYLSEIEINKVANQANDYEVEMRGRNSFVGTATYRGTCLQMIFDNNKKILLLSFYVSLTENPMVLQGTFSGISSKGFPIAGRELLVRPVLLPNIEVPQAFSLKGEKSEKTWEILPTALKNVFHDFDKCYMITNPVHINHYDWRDLE